MGGLGEDILIGGSTTYDNEYDSNALTQIMKEWARVDLDYYGRTSNLYHGVGGYKFNPSIMTDDGVKDQLYGDKDLDWFFACMWDVTDQEPGEWVHLLA